MMQRMNTMKLPSAPNTSLFPAVVWTKTRMFCRTLKVAVATFNTIWVAPGEESCASAIAD